MNSCCRFGFKIAEQSSGSKKGLLNRNKGPVITRQDLIRLDREAETVIILGTGITMGKAMPAHPASNLKISTGSPPKKTRSIQIHQVSI